MGTTSISRDDRSQPGDADSQSTERQNLLFCGQIKQSGPRQQGERPSIVSPTSPGADAYWLQPSELNKAPTPQSPNSTLRCVSCHAAGPYIASPRIAPFLAQFGLLNNGHDTVSGTRRYQAVNSTAMGSVFNAINNLPSWNATIDATLNTSTCANGCHSIGENISVPGITGFSGQELIPALYNDIAAVVNASLMPLGSRKLSEDYRWMNVDLPDDTNTTGDVEVFYDLKANWLGFTPTLNAALTCETEPAYMEAHVVGSNVVVRSDEATAANTGFPDVLEKFNQTGLICRNASQSDGMCSNYVVRYVCLKDKLSVYSRWTGRALTIANADANGTRFAKGQPYNASWGPLSQTWHIEGLNEGTTNYKYVRFQNPWAGIYLNADDSLLVTNALKRDEWLSQQWVMENINGTKFVRFRNLWKTNMYLTMAEDSDFSPVNLHRCIRMRTASLTG